MFSQPKEIPMTTNEIKTTSKPAPWMDVTSDPERDAHLRSLS